jgi:hypothetical protein
MATCLDVVSAALRLARVIAVNREPKASESERGMECLQSLYDQWVASGMFGRLEDTYLTANDTAQEGKRYLLAAGITLTEPTTIAAEDSADGIARQPRDLALYEKLTSTGTRTVRLYDRAAWTELTNLALTDLAPLSGRGFMGLAACLALSGGFSAMFGVGQGINPDVRSLANNFLAGLSYKLGSTRDRSQAEYF